MKWTIHQHSRRNGVKVLVAEYEGTWEEACARGLALRDEPDATIDVRSRRSDTPDDYLRRLHSDPCPKGEAEQVRREHSRHGAWIAKIKSRQRRNAERRRLWNKE